MKLTKKIMYIEVFSENVISFQNIFFKGNLSNLIHKYLKCIFSSIFKILPPRPYTEAAESLKIVER